MSAPRPLQAVLGRASHQRKGEIAVRMAVGARCGQIVRKFLGDGLRLSAYGLALDLPVGPLAVQSLIAAADDVREVSMAAVTAIAAIGSLLVATAAVWIPARRAAAIDPAVTLRRQ